MKLLREPLLHFLVIGAALFGVYQWVIGDDTASEEIVVSAGQIASLQATFNRTWQRPPTTNELESLVDEYIRDEILYREGVAMGLDRDDAVIRRRVRQKMEFVSDLSADAQPTDAELRKFVADHSERFGGERRVSFTHVYFPAGAQSADPQELERLRLALNVGTVDAATAGSPFLMGYDFRGVTGPYVARMFGDDFEKSIESATPNVWLGPVDSAYGTHLVRVTELIEERQRPFELLRDEARREWLRARKEAADNAIYAALKSRYVIKVEPQAIDEKVAGLSP